MLSGLEKPDSGQVLLNSQDITSKRGQVSYMLQKDLLLPYKNIIDNVSLPLILKGEKKQSARKKADCLFKEFGLEGEQYKYPSQLSGGMKQRASLLRTYLCSKDVFLMDEPFSALDAITKSKIHKWYMDLVNKIKVSTIFITHDIDEAIYLSNRIYILKGRPATIIKEIEIKRKDIKNNDFLLDVSFLQYKKYILDILKK